MNKIFSIIKYIKIINRFYIISTLCNIMYIFINIPRLHLTRDKRRREKEETKASYNKNKIKITARILKLGRVPLKKGKHHVFMVTSNCYMTSFSTLQVHPQLKLYCLSVERV